MKKYKKFLSLLLSVAMICTMIGVFGVNVSAADGNIIHITDPSQFATEYCKEFTEDTTIIIDNDLTFTEGLRFSAKTGITVTVQSANPSNPVTITSMRWIGAGCNDLDYMGNIIIKDMNIDIKERFNFSVYNAVNLTMENVTITSKIPLENITDYQSYTTLGIFNWYDDSSATAPINVTLNNCVIDPGNVPAPTDGIAIYTDNVTLEVNNSIIKNGVNPTDVKENFGSGNGFYVNDNLENLNVELNNSSVSGGYSDNFGGGDGIRAHAGNFVLNGSTVVAGGSKSTNSGRAIIVNNGNVIVNGGSVKSDSSSVSINNLFGKWNNESKGTLTINPTIQLKDNSITISPAIENVSLTVNGTETLVTDRNGQATKSSNFKIGDIITLPETIQLNEQITAICNSEDYEVPTSTTTVTATANIPAPAYTVTIPTTVSFGEQTQVLEKYRDKEMDQFKTSVVVAKEFTVSATDVTNLFGDLDDGKADYINVTADFDNTLTGTNKAENTVPYIIKQGDTALTTGATIATFYNDVDLAIKGKTNSVTATIYMNRADIKNADSYTSTMTFNIAVANRAND